MATSPARRLRYHVAVSLDGFIARADGSFDWIVHDEAIDFGAIFRQFDTLVMGRRTYEVAAAQEGGGVTPGVHSIVFSRTLPPRTAPGLQVTNDDPVDTVRRLKGEAGKDLWLFGGGELCRTLLAAGLVDTVEVAVMPVLLGAGIPLLPPGVETRLILSDHRVLPGSGIVALAYRVAGGAGPAPGVDYVTPPAAPRRPRRPASTGRTASPSRGPSRGPRSRR
ncbi:MAG: dihydrofolate reductase family protein [Vicinamibacterales bacterium]